MRIPILFFLTGLVFALAHHASATVYVSKTGDNTNGDAWATAYTQLQPAIDDAQVLGEEVWVAAGTYPMSTAVVARSGVAVYGGFPPTGNPGFGDRNPEQYVTTLDGGGVAGNLIVCQGVSNVRIDGFTMTGAIGAGSGYAQGGAITCTGASTNVTAANCVFTRNLIAGSGAGILVYESNVAVSHCQFLDNSANGSGGIGMYRGQASISDSLFHGNVGHDGGGAGGYESTVVISRCLFTDNQVSNTGGGIEFHEGDSAVVTNCVFAGNRASLHGGGARFDFENDVQIVNCTFVDNTCTTENGGGLVLLRSGGAAVNSIFVNNNKGAIGAVDHVPRPSVDNCLFFNNPDGVYFNDAIGFVLAVTGPSGLNAVVPEAQNNIEGDPLFAGPASGNYHLKYGSPCIDAGANTPAVSDDMDGEARPVDIPGLGVDGTGTEYDIGADEYVDTDRDGLPDVLERLFGTDPNNPDTDGDGVPDAWEVGYDGDIETYNPYDPTTNPTGTDLNATNPDTDGDGVSDGVEIAFGFSPIDPTEWPSLPMPWLPLAAALGSVGLAILRKPRRCRGAND